jgi:hypothetical protein
MSVCPALCPWKRKSASGERPKGDECRFIFLFVLRVFLRTQHEERGGKHVRLSGEGSQHANDILDYKKSDHGKEKANFITYYRVTGIRCSNPLNQKPVWY